MGFLLQNIKQNVKSSKSKMKIIFPEGWNKNIQEAAEQLVNEQNCITPLLCFKNKSQIPSNLNSKIEKIVIEDYDLPQLSNDLYELRKEKGMTQQEASNLIKEPNYFCTMILKKGIVQGYVGGIEMTTKDTLKPALQIIKTDKTSKIVTSAFIMERNEEKYLWGDCAIIAEPTSQELKEIAKSITKAAADLGFSSRNVAMLSYSTAESGTGPASDKVREAVKLLKADSEFLGTCDFEYQFDSAYIPAVRAKKAPNSSYKNQIADIFIFPNLDSGNIGYKIAQRMGGFEATGPLLTGLAKPVNDLSRGASTQDIVNVTYCTAMQVLGTSK